MATLSSMAAFEVISMTTSDVASDDKVDII